MNRTLSPATVRAGLLGGVATSSGVALTATSGWLVVRAAERPVILTLLTAIVAVRAFGMARPVFRYWERLASHDAALATLARRRTRTYAALVPLTPARLGRRRRSDVLTGVVDDLTDEVEAQARVTVPLVSTSLAGLVAVGLAWALLPAVGAVVLALVGATALVCVIAERLESRSLPALLAARADVARVTTLVATEADELRAVGGWATATRWLGEAHARLEGATRRAARGRAAVSGLLLVLVAAAVAVVAVLVTGSDLPGPVRALLVLTPVALSEAAAPLPDVVRALARSRAAGRRVADLVSLAPAVAETTAAEARAAGRAPAGGHVRVEGVGAAWAGPHAPDLDLAPLDLDLPAGSRVVVAGPNGSGKSTLLAVLARHLDPATGHVTWDGADAVDLPLEAVRDRVALVDDDPHVFATTLRHNLTLAAPDASDDDLRAALARAGLGSLLAGLPHGLDTRLGTGGRGLSGGERARLALARAVASGRPVLLLDEPVAHLDPPTARAVVDDVLDGAGSGRTVVMVSHRADGLDRFDRVVRIDPPRR